MFNKILKNFSVSFFALIILSACSFIPEKKTDTKVFPTPVPGVEKENVSDISSSDQGMSDEITVNQPLTDDLIPDDPSINSVTDPSEENVSIVNPLDNIDMSRVDINLEGVNLDELPVIDANSLEYENLIRPEEASVSENSAELLEPPLFSSIGIVESISDNQIMVVVESLEAGARTLTVNNNTYYIDYNLDEEVALNELLEYSNKMAELDANADENGGSVDLKAPSNTFLLSDLKKGDEVEFFTDADILTNDSFPVYELRLIAD